MESDVVNEMHIHLSRRERQIIDIIYQRGRASALDVMKDLPDPPTYSAVRAAISLLEKKGYITHRQKGHRYIYSPTKPHREVRESALNRVMETFCDGSIEKAVAALLKLSNSDLTPEVLDRLGRLIEEAKKEGR